MKTVKEVAKLTGVSVRTLHHYDAIGLLKPTRVTEAGYRMYDQTAVNRLCLILLYRELGFSLKDVEALLSMDDEERNRTLQQQIDVLEQKRRQLQNRICLAGGLKLTGVKNLDYTDFDYKKIDEYENQARTMWGKTEAWQEYSQKAKGRSQKDNKALGDEMMALFAKVGSLREYAPDSQLVQEWVKELQSFITDHYYTCTKPILLSLGQMYAGGGSMTENIDKAGGQGTGEFARQAIEIYCAQA